MNQSRFESNRQMLRGKIVIGIDPAKQNHQAAVVDASGNQRGRSFAFPVSAAGYREILWHRLSRTVTAHQPNDVVFAIETSCNLWETIAFYLHSRGYVVVLVSPLSTHHARPILNLEFSHTDPKDAFLVAMIAQRGAFRCYESFTPQINARHQLAITYDKLRQDLAHYRARIRSLLERVFPEFIRILEPDTQTALYLLKNHLFPDEFLRLDLVAESLRIQQISRRQFGQSTLEGLQQEARRTIGLARQNDERSADRLTLDAYLAVAEALQGQLDHVLQQLIAHTNELPQFARITSLSGVGQRLGALFLAEVRDLSRYTHFKHLEKLAGLNLRLHQSGRYTGSRRLSHIGNPRLRWIIYKMTEETAERVPEVRIKYLRRQLKHRWHVKNVIAATPQLLQLIVSMERHQHAYQLHEQSVTELQTLESQYAQLKAVRKSAA
jgi:transposase